MKILAFEFSALQRSVAVLGQAGLLSEIIETGPGAGRGLAMVEESLREAKLEREQIGGIAVGIGPGSYTGIRLTISLAQGWQLARAVNVFGVSSTECLAAQAQDENLFGRVNAVIDAQRNELYLASYQISKESCKEVNPLRLADIGTVKDLESAGETIIGPEVNRWFSSGKVLFPRAVVVARLALRQSASVSADQLEPIYLRETSFVKAPPARRF